MSTDIASVSVATSVSIESQEQFCMAEDASFV